MATTALLRELLFVLNPISGDLDKTELEDLIRRTCTEHGRQARFFHTNGQQDADRLRAALRQQPPDAVVACGGDGTVNLVAEVLSATGGVLGILPRGSGNGLAKDLGIPLDPEAALTLIWDHEIRAVDTLRVNGHFSAHLADLGFNALVVEQFSRADSRGPGAYIRIATQEFSDYEPATYRIRTDRATFEGPAFMVTLANGNSFGSNVIINPDSPLDDGEFEVCLIAPFSGAAALPMLYQLYTGNFDASAYTQRLSARWAEIEVVGEQRVLGQVDGEPLHLQNPVRAELRPGSLRVLTPARR